MPELTKEEQIKKWAEVYGRPISEEEYREICQNLDGFFNTLKEWVNEEEKRRLKNEQEQFISNERPL
jgi:thiaminase